MQPEGVDTDSEGVFEHAARSEERQNGDLDPEEYGMDPSTNANEDDPGKSFPYLLPMLMLYL
jgi:hypothetical protein